MKEKIIDETKRLYDDGMLFEFEATVLSCEKYNDAYKVILDMTAFFPEGGGQKGDVGNLIVLQDNSSIEVIDTIEVEGEICHIVNKEIKAQEKICGKVNEEIRLDRMRQHSGEHVLCGVIHKKYGFDNVGFALYDDKTTMDVDGKLSFEDIKFIEKEANKKVLENHKIKIFYPSKEQEKDIPYRCKLDFEGKVRVVEIEDTDICACCAPHVAFTGQIGLIKIIDFMPYKGGTRLTILCGNRALEDYNNKDEMIKNLSVKFSTPIEGVVDAVDKLKEESEKRRISIIELEEKLIRLSTPKTFGKFSVSFAEDLDSDVARRYVNEDKKDKVRCIFIGDDENGYKYIVASEMLDLKIFGNELNAALNGRGGGKSEMIFGTVFATENEIEKFLCDYTIGDC